MKLHTLAVAALIALAGPALAQTTPATKADAKTDKAQVKKDAKTDAKATVKKDAKADVKVDAKAKTEVTPAPKK